MTNLFSNKPYELRHDCRALLRLIKLDHKFKRFGINSVWSRNNFEYSIWDHKWRYHKLRERLCPMWSIEVRYLTGNNFVGPFNCHAWSTMGRIKANIQILREFNALWHWMKIIDIHNYILRYLLVSVCIIDNLRSSCSSAFRVNERWIKLVGPLNLHLFLIKIIKE